VVEAALWLGSLELIAAGVFALALLVDLAARRRSAATRRGVWAVAIVIALVLPLTRLVIEAPALSLAPGLAAALLAVWAIGAGLLLARLLVGWATARRWAREARPIESRVWSEGLSALDGGRWVELRSSAAIEGPVTVGVLRPVILVPETMLDIPDDQRRSLLAHELAHVARADCALLLAGGIVRAIDWIDPLAWLALRRLREQAENAADDAVLGAGVTSSSYATHLVALARARLGRAGLRERVVAILDAERRRSDSLACVPRWSGARVVGLAVLLATMVTACEARSEPSEPSDHAEAITRP
jgi:Zn-dependent protease with chaperone function